MVLAGIIICALIGLNSMILIGVLVLILLLIFVLIIKSGAWRDTLKTNVPEIEDNSIDDILSQNRPFSSHREQTSMKVQMTPLQEEKIDSSSVLELHKTVEDLINSIDSEDVRELVREREAELVRRLEDWALEVVDTIDEISRIPHEKGTIAYVERLRSQLSMQDCTLIDSDEWNPELQRAIKVQDAAQPGGTPRIIRKVSTGLHVRGKLVRKQSVIIEK